MVVLKTLLLLIAFGCYCSHAKPANRVPSETVYVYTGDPELTLNQGNLWEGDMIITDAEGIETDDNWLSQKTARFHEVNPWTDGTVLYSFDQEPNPEQNNALTQPNRDEIRAAMNDIQRVSCVKFVERADSDRRPYVHIRGPPRVLNMCGATVGMRNHAGNTLLLSPRCFSTRGFLLHQLMHVLGFYHEHTRTDRDNYIDVERRNIVPPVAQKNFLSYTDPQQNGLGFAYDYDSIMHYPLNAYTESASLNSIYTNRALTSGVVVGQRQHLSTTDVAKINKLYNCPNTVNTVNPANNQVGNP